MPVIIADHTDVWCEVRTIDGLFSDAELDAFTTYVDQADPCNRTFTSSPFKNGKVVDPSTASLMAERIRAHLPEVYVDREGRAWSYDGTIRNVMYAVLQPGQHFGIHTDTGVAFDDDGRRQSRFTVLLYLNDDFEGGHTQFYDDMFHETARILPVRGRTLIFDIARFHAGEQVLVGTKRWIGTELVCKLSLKGEHVVL